MADLAIVQKEEIRVGRAARLSLTRKRELQIAHLPDCSAPSPRAKV